MSKHDVAKRLEKLVAKECNLSMRAAALAKTAYKYHSSRINLQNQMFDQLDEFTFYQTEVKNLEKDNAKLSKLLQENNLLLQDEKQQLQKLRSDYSEYVENNLGPKDLHKLRFLKISTETFINIDKLPELVQGAFKRDHQLVPFKIDPLQCSGTQDVIDTLWQQSRQPGNLNELWHSLISDYSSDNNAQQNMSYIEE